MAPLPPLAAWQPFSAPHRRHCTRSSRPWSPECRLSASPTLVLRLASLPPSPFFKTPFPAHDTTLSSFPRAPATLSTLLPARSISPWKLTAPYHDDSVLVYVWRRKTIRRKEDGNYDDPYGPRALAVTLLVIYFSVFGMGVSKLASNATFMSWMASPSGDAISAV